MKRTIRVEVKEPSVALAAEIVYGHRPAWGNLSYRPLKLNLMRPREGGNVPLIVWLCGGGFTEVDRGVWIPDLAWFAKRGYAVAGVDYSTAYRSRFPEAAEDVKLAIRFLKAHAAEYGIDPGRIALMGESAGGYLCALCALTGKDRTFDKGGYEDYDSEVQAAIPWYPPVRMAKMDTSLEKSSLPHDIANYTDITARIGTAAPPFLILHGSGDTLVPLSQGELLYDSLEKAGLDADMVVLEGAAHGDTAFVQEDVKRIILEFLEAKIPALPRRG
ncbi:MAG: alpha/beta hydrolase [Treponema sp.]|jgi:acetyl esterase/lipase|nr:alpha/beta hydrolase [Treponema sp.]